MEETVCAETLAFKLAVLTVLMSLASIRKDLLPVTSTQVFLGFTVSKSKC
jgi:hypothetical protein